MKDCYRRVSSCSSPIKCRRKVGDIIAFKRKGTSGHVGIVSNGKKYISAGSKKINRKNVPTKKQMGPKFVRAYVWRYKYDEKGC